MLIHVSPEDRAARRVGTILAGKYRVERLLGVGGMASVFMGVHRNGRRVALKMLHEELGIHRDVRARFVREGYVANSVGHPGAVLVFDDDVTEEGAPFLVMEMLEGETLSDRGKRRGGRLPCGEVLALAHQLLDVLSAAHAHGIVHRDIKPENLFLTTGRAVKVLDFGVARLRDEGSGGLATVTGARIGTPAFMPPEQALGRTNEIDARTDVWAVGATMFSLLAGRTVHSAESAAELIVITATTPARSLGDLAPELPKEVIAVVDRALAFARDDRWADAAAMQQALDAAHLAAFGGPLDPFEVGPPPEVLLPVPKLEDDRETQPLQDTPASDGRQTANLRRPASKPRSGSHPPLDPHSATESDRSPVRVSPDQPTTRIPPRKTPARTPAPASSEEPTLAPESPAKAPGDAIPAKSQGGVTPTWRSDRGDVRARSDRSDAGPRSDRSDAGARSDRRELAARSDPGDEDEGSDALGESEDEIVQEPDKSHLTLDPATFSPPTPRAAPSSSRASQVETAGPASAAAPAGRARWIVAAALAMIAGAAGFGLRAMVHPQGSGAPSGLPATTGNGVVAGHAACASNADCKGATASICRKDDGVCVALASDRCKVLASPGDVENDATVWIGAMYPYSDPDPREYGPRAAEAIELARRDFAETSGGLPPARAGGPKRPIGVVLCDDRTAHVPVAEHLVRDLRVPAVLGFSRSKEVMELSSSLFLPNGVLALASNTALALRDIPHAPGESRLVWRVTTSGDMTVPPTAELIEEVVEPDVRAALPAAQAKEPIRLAVVRVANPSGQGIADMFLSAVRFNGKSIAENGPRFRQLAVGDTPAGPETLDAAALREVLEFEPHVVLLAGPTDEVFAQIEEAWPKGAAFRPRYVHGSATLADRIVRLVQKDPSLRRRLYGVDGTSSGEALSRFVLRHNEVFPLKQTMVDSTTAPYDAFYVFAYAAAALGSQPITGKGLASSIRRLSAPGEAIDVGAAGIFRAFYALGAGRNIDLQGSATTLDFDPETGDATADMAVYCLTPGGPGEPPRQVESGLFFRAKSKKLEGKMRCP